jgi:hypothetical protein
VPLSLSRRHDNDPHHFFLLVTDRPQFAASMDYLPSATPSSSRIWVDGARAGGYHPDRMGNGDTKVYGQWNFSTPFSGSRCFPEIRIETHPSGCLHIKHVSEPWGSAPRVEIADGALLGWPISMAVTSAWSGSGGLPDSGGPRASRNERAWRKRSPAPVAMPLSQRLRLRCHAPENRTQATLESPASRSTCTGPPGRK